MQREKESGSPIAAAPLTERDGFAGYVARNVPPAYRLATIVLDDPVGAQHVVHDAAMAAWQLGSLWPAGSLDDTFGRRFVDTLRKACRKAADEGATRRDTNGSAGHLDEAADAYDALAPRDRLVIAERLALPVRLPAVAKALGAKGKLSREFDRLVETLAKQPAFLIEEGDAADAIDAIDQAADGRTAGGRAGATAQTAEAAGMPEAATSEASARLGVIHTLESLFHDRDPEFEPSQLRWHLQRSLIELEAATTEQAEISTNSAWGFAVKAILVMAIIVLAVSVASISALNGSAGAQSEDAQLPAAEPLSVARILAVSIPAGAGEVSVAATTNSLLATLDVTAISHAPARDCRVDVVGTTDPTGTFGWRGDLGGHAYAVAGDPRTQDAFLLGTGSICAPFVLGSENGGGTWTELKTRKGASPLTGDLSSITWLAADPVRAGTLVVAADSRIWAGTRGKAGTSTWTSAPFDGVPLGFDPGGVLIAWQNGRLVDSRDDGATWLQLGKAPVPRPTSGAALARGVAFGSAQGLWWYPFGGEPALVSSNPVLSLSSVATAALVAGTDQAGHAWLATFRPDDARPLVTTLLPDPTTGKVVSASVAVNAGQGLVAFRDGSGSRLYLVEFGA